MCRGHEAMPNSPDLNFTALRVDLVALQAAAQALAPRLCAGQVVYLEGPLGAGKTTFVQALLAALAYRDAVKSPTYSLVESYALTEFELFHFDLYRLKDPSECAFMGLRDYLRDDALCVFEWPDKGAGYLPPPQWHITLEYAGAARFLSITENKRERMD